METDRANGHDSDGDLTAAPVRRNQQDRMLLHLQHNPKTVALIGMGPSLIDYMEETLTQEYGSDKKPAPDEVWAINMASNLVRAAATAVPHLSAGLVTPTVGNQATVFQYIVTYTSPSGAKPVYVHALIDGAVHAMRPLDPVAGTYVYETNMPPHKRDAPHTYAYETSDGRYTARFPEDGSTMRGPLVSGDASAPGGVAGLFGARSVPAGGIFGFSLAILGAAALVTIIVRRKREGSK